MPVVATLGTLLGLLPGVVQVGDVVVIEGDDQITLRLGDGSYTLEDPATQDRAHYPALIAERFLASYPDEYDGIAIFTSFEYASSYSGVAICGEQVSGLGSSLAACPGTAGRLLSVTVLKNTSAYADPDFGDDSFVYVAAHEWGHSWVSFYPFRDPVTGAVSHELLSPDGAHWSMAAQSEGSFVGGVNWRDNGDGTLTMVDLSARYGSLDLYGMGLLAPAEVPPFFIVRRADGLPIDSAGAGITVTGTRLDLTIDDIIAAAGPRLPAWSGIPRRFRQAFVLVTEPGQTAADVMDQVALLERLRQLWEDRFADETRGRASMCTAVDGGCPASSAVVEDLRIEGVLDPGGAAMAVVTFRNNRLEPTTEATGRLEAVGAAPGLTLPPPHTLSAIPSGGQIEDRFPIAVTAAACGTTTTLVARGDVEGREWSRSLEVRPGLVEGPVEEFAADHGWQADADGTDTATAGRWGRGIPEWANGHGGPGDPAWFTGLGEHWFDGGVAGGATTLVSAAYDVSTVYRPVLRYFLYYNALDTTTGQFTPVDESHLRVEVSIDGGASYRLLQAVSGSLSGWVRQEVALDPVVEPDADTVRFRFIADDDLGAERIVVAGIDGVALLGQSDACRDETDPGGCGCHAGNDGPAVWLGPLAVLGLFRPSRRRRRQ